MTILVGCDILSFRPRGKITIKDYTMAKEAPAKPTVNANLDAYQDGRAASGAKTKHNGDPVAVALGGATLDETYAVASALTDVAEPELREKYAHLNVGMQRMNLGNRIRKGVATMNESKAGSGDAALKKHGAVIAKRVATDAKAKAAEEKAAAAAKEAEKKAKAAAKKAA